MVPRQGTGYRWVQRVGDLEEAVRSLVREPYVAVDLEADSLYRYEERICLIQISGRDGDWLIDALAIPTLEPLRPLLEDPGVEKVLHGADYDIRLLKRCTGIQPYPIFDTMVAAQIVGLPKVGLSDLLLEKFGVELVKRFQKADWGRRPLPDAMVRYALEDTRHLLRLKEALVAELQALGRLDWARRQFEALLQVRPRPRTPPDALRIPGSRDLDDRGRAVLQALLDWREEVARKRDVPPFKVMGTEALLTLARRAEALAVDLEGIPGLSSRLVATLGEGIREAIRKGYNAPPIPWSVAGRPSPAKTHRGGRRRFILLKAVRDTRARELGLDPGVLCPNAALKELALSPPEGLEASLDRTLKDWQREILAEEFRKALLGTGG